MRRWLGLALIAASLACAAQAETVFAWSATANNYAWCGDAGCAVGLCAEDGATDCAPVASCGPGWTAVARPEEPTAGIAVACGADTPGRARMVAVSECLKATNELCWTGTLLTPDLDPVPQDQNRAFDRAFYVQALLQLTNLAETEVTGTLDPATVAAIGDFQSGVGLPVTGSTEPPLIFHLLAASPGRQVVIDKLVDALVTPNRAEGFTAAAALAPSPLPRTTKGADLLAMAPEDRAAALATYVLTRGFACDRMGATASAPDPDGEIWFLACTATRYTVTFAAGTGLVVPSEP